MLKSVLIGAVAGLRSLTPLAMVSEAARRGALHRDSGAPELLARPVVTAAVTALAAGELLGDKLPWAPDRIVLPGMAARIVTGAVTGAALARRDRRTPAALLGAGAAVAAAYLSFHARRRAIARWGQTPTGLVEDAVAIGGAWLAVNAARPVSGGNR